MTDDIENNKIMGHLFYTTSSSVHHFKAIGEFKLELQSGNAQFGLKSAIFPLWPWNLTDDLEKQQNNEAPLLYYVKLCASFQSHQWIQTGVTVRKRSIRDKIGDFFCPMWPSNSIDDLQNHKVPVLYYVGLCAGVTVRKFESKSVIFSSVWPWNFIDDLAKIGPWCAFSVYEAGFTESAWLVHGWTINAYLNIAIMTVKHCFCTKTTLGLNSQFSGYIS